MYSLGNSKPLRRLIGTTNTEPDHPQKQFAKPINTNEIKYIISARFRSETLNSLWVGQTKCLPITKPFQSVFIFSAVVTKR